MPAETPTAISNEHPAADMEDYVTRSGKRKEFVALELGIRPERLSKLIRADRYRPNVDDDLAKKIAKLWRRPLAYVRTKYPEGSAA